jgi:parvulin-like peptidyl-prolyl isomerase
VTIPFRRFTALPIGLALLALAGCGSSAGAGTSTSTSTPPTPSAIQPPTPPPVTPATITGGSTAAIVNGNRIPMSDFRFLFTVNQHRAAGQPGSSNQVLAQQTMNEVILDELVREYAVPHHITVSQSELQAHVKSDMAQAGGQKPFTTRLAQFGLTKASYMRLLAPALLTQKVEQAIAPPSTAPVPVAHVRHILIATKPQGKPARTNAQAKALAETVLGKLQHGSSFATLAKKYSDDTGSAATGGDLGNVYPNQTVPPFNHAAFTQPLKTYHIVHSVYGYHIIEVLSRGKAPMPAQQQQQAEQQKFGQWLNARMAASKIQRIAKVK